MKQFKLSNRNIELYNSLYNVRYSKFGYSPKSLGWWTGKQDIRFKILTDYFDINEKSVLDVGCGFADLFNYLNLRYHNFYYTGVDLNSNLLKEAERNILANDNPRNWNLVCADFLDNTVNGIYNLVVVSGLFSTKLIEQDNYEYVESVISKGFEMSKEGVALDFCTCFYGKPNSLQFMVYNPVKIMEIAYKYSKRLLLFNDYFPTEFSLIILKNENYNANFIYDEYEKNRIV